MENKLTYRQGFEIQFSRLRQCPAEDLGDRFMSMMELYLLSDSQDRIHYIASIGEFAETQKEYKPLLFAYASFMNAFHLFYTEKYEASLTLLTETQHQFEGLGEVNGVAICQGVCAAIYRTMGMVDLSLKGMLAVYHQLKGSEVFAMFTTAMGVNIASIYAEQKHFEEAMQLFNEMLNMPGRDLKFYWDVYSLHGLAKVYLAHEEPRKALDCLQRAMAISERKEHPISICNSLSELGNYYARIGELAQSEEYYHRSLVLREKYKLQSGAATSCIRLAELYIRQSRMDESIAMLNKGLTIAEEIKVKPKIYQVHRLLSQVYESKGDLKMSLSHFKKFQQLQSEVEAEDNARKVKNVKAYFEAEQTKKENAVIKQQKEEIERKNIELQETIDELTRVRVGKKARAITFLIAIVLFIFQDAILSAALNFVNTGNYFVSLLVKMGIIFSLAPINRVIEKQLLKRALQKKAVPTLSEPGFLGLKD